MILQKRKIDSENEIDLRKYCFTDIQPILPGIKDFFSNTVQHISINQPDSSDDDEEGISAPKRKKLTPAEKVERAKAEEERLRKIEEELADTSRLPETADQFDRALLGNPEDSEMWTRYIAFHAEATEFEKARVVARRAIERIPYTSTQERLNIWIAYLNLENMYGTKETFDKVFYDAVMSNDALIIYIETIKMLAEMSKFEEMDDKIKKVRGKFKQDVNMWLEVGKVYYQCKRFADARKLKDAALLTITDKRTHVNLIVQFAIMEFNYGEEPQGEAIFETILQSDPKRVDVWCTYIDQLIKKEKVEIARNVLQRAVGQKLPYKKMRTLFKKYYNFELKFGNEETIENVKELLKKYAN